MGLVSAYEILGIKTESSLDEIRQAFKAKAFLYHPDRGGQLEHFVRIQQAYELLTDTNLREKLGDVPRFEKLPLRLQPSLSKATSTLFENLSNLEDRLKVLPKK